MGAIAAWAVLTIVFALFTQTDEWALRDEVADFVWAGDEEAVERIQEEYFAVRGTDEHVLINYLDWMTDIILLDWGESFLTGESAITRVFDAVIVTGSYVLPAIALAITIGIGFGVYAALNPQSRLANASISVSYLLFAVPSFWVGGLLISYAITGHIGHNHLLFNYLLPVAFTTAALLGGYVSYARAHSLEYATSDFVKLVKAKGGSRWLLAKHVARNSAIPFFSMLFAEAIGLLVLAIFVIEVLFGINGFGLALFESIQQRDLPVLLGGTVVIIAISVVGNILQDLTYSYLDPRVDTAAR